MTEETQEDEAPLFKRWSVWYTLVIGFLILLILVFYFITKKFS